MILQAHGKTKGRSAPCNARRDDDLRSCGGSDGSPYRRERYVSPHLRKFIDLTNHKQGQEVADNTEITERSPWDSHGVSEEFDAQIASMKGAFDQSILCLEKNAANDGLAEGLLEMATALLKTAGPQEKTAGVGIDHKHISDLESTISILQRNFDDHRQHQQEMIEDFITQCQKRFDSLEAAVHKNNQVVTDTAICLDKYKNKVANLEKLIEVRSSSPVQERSGGSLAQLVANLDVEMKRMSLKLQELELAYTYCDQTTPPALHSGGASSVASTRPVSASPHERALKMCSSAHGICAGKSTSDRLEVDKLLHDALVGADMMPQLTQPLLSCESTQNGLGLEGKRECGQVSQDRQIFPTPNVQLDSAHGRSENGSRPRVSPQGQVPWSSYNPSVPFRVAASKVDMANGTGRSTSATGSLSLQLPGRSTPGFVV